VPCLKDCLYVKLVDQRVLVGRLVAGEYMAADAAKGRGPKPNGIQAAATAKQQSRVSLSIGE
jgi:hypothetical protein